MKIVFFIALLAIIGCFFIPFRYKVKLNAHALGAYKGKTYTNAKEAFFDNYENGFRYFEIDISITKDGHFVISHEVEKVSQLTKEEFLTVSDDLTPMTLTDMFNLMKNKPDITVMFDFLPSFYNRQLSSDIVRAFLQQFDKSLYERSIIEVYSKQHALSLKESGFRNIQLWVDPDDEKGDFHSITDYQKFLEENDIHIISASKWTLQKYDITPLLNKDLTVFSVGYNNIDDLKWGQKNHVNIITTDFLQPNMLKYPLYNYIKYSILKLVSSGEKKEYYRMKKKIMKGII